MHFWLTNSPTIFQGWMNFAFKLLLGKFILVFFNDIFIYSKNINEHWHYLSKVFQLMQQNRMYVQSSKCSFVVKKIEYLGHFILEKGVETDPHKLFAVCSWQVPSFMKELRGLLGLTEYFKKCIRRYVLINRPLTDMLKK